MTNEELIAEIKAGRSRTDNLLQLYIQNHGIIFRWCKPLSYTFEMEDLMQESFLALCDAVANYDQRQEGSFLSVFRYAMLNHFRALRRDQDAVSIPEYLHDMIRQYKRMRDAYLLNYGKEPTNRVYCQSLRITYKDLLTIWKNMTDKARSLQEPVCDIDGEEIYLEDTVADETSGTDEVLDRIEQEELKAIIDKMLRSLPDVHQKIIQMRFYDQYTLRQCAEHIGTHAEKIRQIETKAIRQLRNQSDNMRVLEEFVSDQDVYDMGMIYRSVPAFRNTLESTTETAAFTLMNKRRKTGAIAVL